jgi:hypothetical protein
VSPSDSARLKPFLDCALDAHQTDAEHVFGHLADAADAAVAEMVDVVNLTVAVANVDQYLEHRQNVFHRQHAGRTLFGRHAGRRCAAMADSTVEFHPTDIRQIVTLRREEQIVQQALRGILGRRLARAHHPVDFDLRFPLAAGGIRAQGVGEIGAAIDVVDVKRWNSVMPDAWNLFKLFQSQLVVRLCQQFAGLGVAQIASQNFADQDIRSGTRRLCTPALTSSLDVLGFHPLTRFQQLAVIDHDVEAGGFTLQALGDQIQGESFRRRHE